MIVNPTKWQRNNDSFDIKNQVTDKGFLTAEGRISNRESVFTSKNTKNYLLDVSDKSVEIVNSINGTEFKINTGMLRYINTNKSKLIKYGFLTNEKYLNWEKIKKEILQERIILSDKKDEL
jgi:hypothetical protein